MKNNKIKVSDYFMTGILFLGIAIWSYIFIFIWGKAVIILLEDKDYETLGLLFILTGILSIIFGYFFKTWVSSRVNVTQDMNEFYQKLRERYKSNEKIHLNYKIDLWIIDGYSIKIGNRIGIALIFIGVIIYIVKYVI
ncbi:hypothetical protein [Arcobacter sp. CECT 9188]|uniref:hypothetical protein n=1 Tax=Arcobacter sp. CECT 9188 TaxID=2044505 RepID=UPI000DEAB8F4|nr:hypothetical protein [Arcobacter sp. CECT 9188]RBQ27217.1 hypothetical protein CRU88_00705 [Arcobacter sp. CECT 9188]